MNFKVKYKVGGCLPQPKDKRDWKFKKYIKPLLKAIYLPDNYESNVPNDFVFDQENSDQCCACAYSVVRMIQEYDQSGLNEPFSPSFTYANRRIGEYEGEGMMLRDCCKQGKYGSILWSEFPCFYSYKEARKIFNKNKDKFLKHAYPFRINSFYTAHSDLEIMQAVYLTKAVLIGIKVTEPFYHPNELGYIDYSDNNETSEEGHALLIKGWKTVDGIKYWIIQNSWGNEWGNNGTGYIKFDDLRKYLMDDAYVLVDETNEIRIEKYKELYSNIKYRHSWINKIIKYFKNLFKS